MSMNNEDHPFRICEFCGCNTNALLRRCCDNGYRADIGIEKYNVWQNRLDSKYDMFVETKDNGYSGDLIIKEGDKELLREHVSISFGARFGPDIGDIIMWEERCIEFIDAIDKKI